MTYIIVFAVGLLAGVLLTLLFAQSWINTQVYKRCEIHSRFPKSWSTDDCDYYYKNTAEQMIKYLDFRGRTYRGTWSASFGRQPSVMDNDQWLTICSFIRMIHSMGLTVKIYELTKDGGDLEKDPTRARYEIWEARHKLYPDIHAGFTF